MISNISAQNNTMRQNTSFGATRFPQNTLAWLDRMGINKGTSISDMADHLHCSNSQRVSLESIHDINEIKDFVYFVRERKGSNVLLSQKEIAKIKESPEKLYNSETRVATLKEKFALLRKMYDEATPAPQNVLDKIEKVAQKILSVEEQQQTRHAKIETLLTPKE